MEEKSKGRLLLDEYTPKAFDNTLKSGFKTVMSNIGTVLAIMCISLLITIFLFDVGIEDIDMITLDTVSGFVVDAIITVVLYICMQNSMILNGEKNGRLDDEFILARENAAAKRDAAKKKGAPRMGEFCSAWAARELIDVINRRLTKIPLRYDEWTKYFAGKGRREINRMPKKFKVSTEEGGERKILLTKKKKAILTIINSLEERVFTPEMLMYDDTSFAWRRAPLMPSPEDKIRASRRSNYLPTIIFAVMTAFLVFKFSASPTWSTAIYCLFKLFGLIWRGGAGYSIGFLAYSVHGVKYYQSIELRFVEYENWLEKDGDDSVFDF